MAVAQERTGIKTMKVEAIATPNPSIIPAVYGLVPVTCGVIMCSYVFIPYIHPVFVVFS